MIDIKKYTQTLNFFNLSILILTPENSKILKEVKKPNIFEPNSQMFDREGLFSTEIFGPIGSNMRMYKPGYIDLGLSVLHGAVFEKVLEMGTLYRGIIAGEIKAVFDETKNDFIPVTDENEKGQTGYSFFINNIGKVATPTGVSGSIETRHSIVELGTKPEKMLEKFIVIPAGLRDYTVDKSGKSEEDEINTLYRRVLSIVSMIKNTTLDKSNIELLDPLRYKLQLATYEIYEYIANLVGKGKGKFIQDKWTKRAIMFGTRNVITANPIYIQDLDAENKITFNDTVIGLYQFIKSITPIAANKLLEKFISRFINPHTDTAVLINPKTMKTEMVEIPIKRRDEWLSLDGINNLFNKFGQDDVKGQSVKVGDYYLMLVYDEGNKVTYYFNTDEIPDNIDKKLLRPITYVELLYIAIYDVRHKYPAFLTRYPVAALGGIYPSYLYVKTTIIGRTIELVMDGVSSTIYEYPKLGEEYMNSLSISTAHLNRAGADHDGDTMSENTLTTRESIEEVARIINSKEYYITPDGQATYSITTPTLEFTLAHMSDTINILKVKNFLDVIKNTSESKIVAGITAVYKEAFQGKADIKTIQTWIDKNIKDGGQRLFVCVNGKNKVFGYARYREISKSDKNQLHGYFAKTDTYGFLSDLGSIKRGCGQKLMKEIIKLADLNNVDLILNLRNKTLIPYYEKFGFVTVDTKSSGLNLPKEIMVRYIK